MDFMPSFERTTMTKWSTKDVNEVYVKEELVGVGTYGYINFFFIFVYISEKLKNIIFKRKYLKFFVF